MTRMTEKKPTLEYGMAPQRRHTVAYRVVTWVLILYASVMALLVAVSLFTAM